MRLAEKVGTGMQKALNRALDGSKMRTRYSVGWDCTNGAQVASLSLVDEDTGRAAGSSIDVAHVPDDMAEGYGYALAHLALERWMAPHK